MNLEELKGLQAKIIKKNKTANKIGTIVIITILLILSSVVFFKTKNIMSVLLSDFFCFIFCFIILTIVKTIINGKDIRLFNKEFKNIFVFTALKSTFQNVKYSPDKGFSESFVDEIGMINTSDRFNSNDYISGTYKGIKFEQSDMHIEEEHETTDSEGNKTTTWITIFRGRLMIFDFNKSFKSNIRVSTKYFRADKLPWSKKFSKIKMEDVEFNKLFSIYSQSEHEAFYILTPHFMEKIKTLTNNLNCGIMYAFIDNKLYIAIDNNTDSFEYNVFKVIDEQKINEDLSKDIRLITKFVEELNLEKDLFRKEV